MKIQNPNLKRAVRVFVIGLVTTAIVGGLTYLFLNRGDVILFAINDPEAVRAVKYTLETRVEKAEQDAREDVLEDFTGTKAAGCITKKDL